MISFANKRAVVGNNLLTFDKATNSVSVTKRVQGYGSRVMPCTNRAKLAGQRLAVVVTNLPSRFSNLTPLVDTLFWYACSRFHRAYFFRLAHCFLFPRIFFHSTLSTGKLTRMFLYRQKCHVLHASQQNIYDRGKPIDRDRLDAKKKDCFLSTCFFLYF